LSGFFNSLQLFSGLEAHCFAWRDIHFFAGSRVAPNACLARFHAEYAKAPELDALAAAQCAFQRLENGFHRLLGLGAADIGGRHHRIDDIQLDHRCLQRLGRC